MRIIEWAQFYRSRGLSVVPVPRGEKRPAIDWAKYQWRHATDEEMAVWWPDGTTAGIAVITGGISGVTVLDAVTEAAVAALRETRIVLPTAPRVRTARGWHFYLPYDPAFRAAPNGLTQFGVEGVDVLNYGRLAVLPPSCHASGVLYAWEVPLA